MSETNEKPTTSISSKYVLISVEKTETPEGLPGTNWHEYIIERGNSQIVGKKPGSLKQVTEHANTMIEGLNERSGIPSSSTYASRQISKPKVAETKTEEKDPKDKAPENKESDNKESDNKETENKETDNKESDKKDS